MTDRQRRRLTVRILCIEWYVALHHDSNCLFESIDADFDFIGSGPFEGV
jgi:hypothetical protein